MAGYIHGMPAGYLYVLIFGSITENGKLKIYIGPYKNWFGPYQIAEKLCFWAKKEKDEYGIMRHPDWVHDFGEWLGGKDDHDTWLTKVCQWIGSKRKQTIKVKIDRWDTWSMDHTLSHIVLPMLKQLNESKHGSPFVDDEDVPEGVGLRSTEAGPKENEYDTDDNHFKRWDWVMGEMIFAFECKVDDSWEDAFRSGDFDTIWLPVDREGNPVPKEEAKLFQMADGPNHTYKCDYEGMRVVETRIQNGFRLFGKYYQGLWD
jgi:hypothetical protein